jgi:hypothetical protein
MRPCDRCCSDEKLDNFGIGGIVTVWFHLDGKAEE